MYKYTGRQKAKCSLVDAVSEPMYSLNKVDKNRVCRPATMTDKRRRRRVKEDMEKKKKMSCQSHNIIDHVLISTPHQQLMT